MLKTLLILLCLLTLIVGCSSKQDELKLELHDKLITHLQRESLRNNGSAHLDTCLVLQVDTLNQHQFDSVLLASIRKHRDYYDSLADAYLRRGNMFNHEAYAYQQAGDTTSFNLAILNATDSHYQAGSFIDSSMAIQKTAEYLRNRIKTDTSSLRYLQAKVYVKATFFSLTDSTKLQDTLFYHFDPAREVLDVNKEINKLVDYDLQ